MTKLWKFYWDCGRMGSLEGLFVASEAQVSKIIGKHVYFGEVLGKHSDISGNISQDSLELIDIDADAVAKILAVTGPTVSGYNPFDYWEPEEDEDLAEEPEEDLFDFSMFLGKDADQAVLALEERLPGYDVGAYHQNAIVTADYRLDRIRVWHDDDNHVVDVSRG